MSKFRRIVGAPSRCLLRYCAVAFLGLLLPGATALPDDVDPTSLSFRYDVLPTLSKLGCSAGACHGSPTGKGNFRLSLRGFDPELDHHTIVREFGGRRINRLAPADSLLLQKPAMQVAHGGGYLLKPGSPEYERVARWIAGAEPALPEDTSRFTSISASVVSERLTWPDWKTRVTVVAQAVDGSSRDISDLAIFSSSDAEIVDVDQQGVVRGLRRGEATIMVRYLDWIDTVNMRLSKPRAQFQAVAVPQDNVIDQIVFDRLNDLQITPAERCSDQEFLRRVFLDLTGTLPTRHEAESFLTSDAVDKRRELVDDLLSRPEHADFWAQKWADLLRVRADRLGAEGAASVHHWLREALTENRPLDALFREILTATGRTDENPVANMYRAFANESELAEGMSQLLLGIRIQCAKCHNHPSDRWSQDNYYGLSAIFSRVERAAIEGTTAVDVKLKTVGEVIQPRTGEAMAPWVPGGRLLVGPDLDRREAFADWLFAPENQFFATVVANRIWAELLGRGIVHPVDDFRADNPASHPELLAALGAELRESRFDQRHLVRQIVNSSVYQLSSRAPANEPEDEKYFSRFRARLLDAEPLLDAISQVTQSPTQFSSGASRATELVSPALGNQFLKVFGQPNRNTVCECERSGDPKLAQALELINGKTIPTKVADPDGRLMSFLYDRSGRSDAAGEPPQEGLVAWFRADREVLDSDGQAVRDGAAVASWSSGKWTAAQAAPDQRPLFRDNGLAGLPGLEFDGSDDFLHNTDKTILPTGSPRTIVVVGQLQDDTGGALFTFGRQRVNGSAVFTAQHVAIGGKHYVYSDGVNGAGNTTVPLATRESLQRPFVTTFLSHGVGSKLQVRLNGSTLATSQSGGVGEDAAATGFTIGSREDIPVAQQIWNGIIAEVLIYDHVLTDEELHNAGVYAATKYDLDSTYEKRPYTITRQVPDRTIIEDFYWAALTRAPTARELQISLAHIAAADTRQEGLRDVVWALLNSREFLFQH